MAKMSRRVMRTADIEKMEDPKERMVALNDAVQSLHYGHNEVRRLVPLLLSAVVEVLSPEPKAKKPAKADA